MAQLVKSDGKYPTVVYFEGVNGFPSLYVEMDMHSGNLT